MTFYPIGFNRTSSNKREQKEKMSSIYNTFESGETHIDHDMNLFSIKMTGFAYNPDFIGRYAHPAKKLQRISLIQWVTT